MHNLYPYIKSKFSLLKKRFSRKYYFNSSNNSEEIFFIGKKILDLFNEDFYLELNPDVKNAGEDPKEHFLKFGIDEGRPWQVSQKDNSSNDSEEISLIGKKILELFNEDLYLELNPDVKKAGEDPKEHLLKFGIYEGRPWQLIHDENTSNYSE